MSHSDAVDLTNCDREPIHIPGSIQPHGCLLTCDVGATVIRRHSENAREMLAIAAADLNGLSLNEAIGDRAAHDVRNALALSIEPSRPGLILGFELPDGRGTFDIAAHQSKAGAIIEFEPSPPAQKTSPLELMRTLVARLRRVETVDSLVASGARLLRAVLGYDRVMVYRFAEDGSGQVISEAKRSDLESFMGQHFPASDIPQQARQLYLQNTIRIISDAAGHRVPIHPAIDASGQPLDLSFAHLRSVSPVHCEYLRNMGVGASMSISLIIGGKLWGLIACHHYAPRTLAMAQRVAAEMLGEFFSLHLDALLQQDKLRAAERARVAIDGFLRGSDFANFDARLRDDLRDFAKLMPCDGVGLWMANSFSAHGVAPPGDEIPALAQFVNSVADGKVWATNALSENFAAATDYADVAAGVLAVPLSQIPRDYLFFFRREVVQTLNWAGDPEKKYQFGPLGDRLTPRKSFAIWKQTVERQSKPWTRDDREIADATRIALVEVALRHNEVVADERSKAEVRQKMLNEELNHRVKNILALIKSLVSHPLEAGRTLEDYVSSLKGRIQALALAHDQVVRGAGGGALPELLGAELSPYRDAAGAMTLNGPDVTLDARAYSVMALVLHELATNAAKYGALSRAGGRLDVNWTRRADHGCEIVWTESGGPPVKPPNRQGFGSVLVSRSVPFDLGGESDIAYDPRGVRARIVIPAKFVSWIEQARPKIAARGPAAAHDANVVAGKKALLVEDQLLIAMDAEAMLFDEGASTVEICSSADEALSRLASFTPDVAVLDVNLGTGTSQPVAEELFRRRVPFVLATGYGDQAMISEAMKSAPIIRKPYDRASLAAVIAKALAAARE